MRQIASNCLTIGHLLTGTPYRLRCRDEQTTRGVRPVEDNSYSEDFRSDEPESLLIHWKDRRIPNSLRSSTVQLHCIATYNMYFQKIERTNEETRKRTLSEPSLTVVLAGGTNM